MKINLLLAIAVGITVWISHQTPAPPALSPRDKQIAEAFEQRARAYTKMREQLEEQMPKLSKEATPEEIQTHKQQFQQRVRAARAGAKHGDVFTPEEGRAPGDCAKGSRKQGRSTARQLPLSGVAGVNRNATHTFVAAATTA